MSKMIQTTPVPTRVVLLGVKLPHQNPQEIQEHLEELAALAHTRGFDVRGTFMQRLTRPYASMWIGPGKVAEVAAWAAQEQIDLVICDEELSPGQLRNLAEQLACTVWDRAQLILEIFARQARTAQAKAQVELAQYQYLFPRLRGMWSHHSRQQGGVKGMRGPGEKELETDKRLVQNKIHLLKQKLEAIQRQSQTQRLQRGRAINVALVGYTCAGKSTLMAELAQVDVLIQDKLFSTLATTVRKVVLEQTPFLLSDTVGFIRKLPHHLIESFKATLAEVKTADLLLHVVDYAHPRHQEHIQVVNQTLEHMGAHTLPVFLLLNKYDRVAEQTPDPEGVCSAYQVLYGHPTFFISALEKVRLERFKMELGAWAKKAYQERYPHNQEELLS